MKYQVQVAVAGGILFVSSSWMPGSHAYAFGQQWRPAAAHAAYQARPYQQHANLPSFRPHGVSQQAAASQVPRYSRAERPARVAAWRGVSTGSAYGMRPTDYHNAPAPSPAWHAVPPAPAYAAHQPAAYAQPGYAPSSPQGMAGWMGPFGEMAQAWHPVPMFARQFAWRPAEQPWSNNAPASVSRYAPAYQPPGYHVPMAPSTASYQPLAQSRPAYSRHGWRPVADGTNGDYRQPAYRPATVAYTQPAPYGEHWRSAARPMPQMRVAAVSPRPATAAAPFVAAQWRPHAATPADYTRPARDNFRPASYGRSTLGAELAQHESPRQGLPGWATTYDDGSLSSCAWCSGS